LKFMSKLTVSDLTESQVRGKRILFRADFNVPLDASGQVSDDTRIRSTLPTIRALQAMGGRVILASPLGRPKGEADPSLSLAPVARALESLLETPVAFVPAIVGRQVEEAVAGLGEGGVLLLENTRFLPGETANDPGLSEDLARLADLFVMDAFGTAHRAHASTEGAARVIRDRGGLAVAGLLLERELRFLGEALAAPERPFVAVMGGAKISGKIDVIEALLPRVDLLLIGGAMANTFFLALGLDTGKSLVEPDRVEMAARLLDAAGERILLPVDCVVGDVIGDDARTRVAARTEVGAEELIGDIGPETALLFGASVAEAGTILWNGPMGVFESGPYAEGTLAVARSVATATRNGAVSVVGGGDSAAAAEVAGVADSMTHISTGGGASLEFLAGRELPGVAVLSEGA
jgi:phosphoglycerate kinase